MALSWNDPMGDMVMRDIVFMVVGGGLVLLGYWLAYVWERPWAKPIEQVDWLNPMERVLRENRKAVDYLV